MGQHHVWFVIRFLFHVVASCHLGYAVYYEYKYARMPNLAIELRFVTALGGKFKYLTFLNGLLQTGYYVLSTIYDLLPNHGLRHLRDYLLATLVVPLSLTVSITFWSLCAINGKSIYPVYLNVIFPFWLKHTMHTIIVVYVLLELCLGPHRYPRRTRGLTGLAVALGLYLLWIKFCHYWTGIWVYPFLSALTVVMRWYFFAVIIALSFCYYLVGERLNFALWVQ